MKKSLVWIGAILVICVAVVFFWRNFGWIIYVQMEAMKTPTKQEIIEMVQENYNILWEDIQNENFEKSRQIKGIESVS